MLPKQTNQSNQFGASLKVNGARLGGLAALWMRWLARLPGAMVAWLGDVDWRGLSRNLVFRALAISCMVHVLAFGGVKWGQDHGWWRSHATPAWMRFIQEHLRQAALKNLKNPLPQPKPLAPARDIPTTFVDVDPSLASETPPKEKLFYGAANTLAASPVQKEAPLPQITGKQDKILKTTDPTPLDPKPLQPTPKIEPKSDPTPEVKPQPAKPQPEPMQAHAPGELAMTKPQDQARSGKADTAQVNPPATTHPRTVEEAMRKRGMQTEKSRQEGGSSRLAMESTLDVSRTAAGDYDREFIDAVQQRWNKLLEDRSGSSPGKVIIVFKLHADGRITDLKVTQSDVGELFSLLCRKAIEDPAPYRRWPVEMRREINADFRDITFTFYYLNQ